jgi:AraC-like DNA-binding protein
MTTNNLVLPFRSANRVETSTTSSVDLATTPAQLRRPGYLHLGVVKEIAPVLRAFRLDPDLILEEAGLDPRLFDGGANVMSYSALGRLLTISVARTSCPHFGLLVGGRATILSLGIVGRLMQHSETLHDALHALVSNLSIQNRGAVPSLSFADDIAIFSYSVYQPNVESVEQISDVAIAVAVNSVRSLCGSGWNPTEVLLPRAPVVDSEPFRCLFRAPVRFNQEVAAFVFPARDLDLRIAGADHLLRAMLVEQIRKLTAGPRSEFSDDIRRLLRTRLTSRHCSAEAIADQMAMHRRTLSRRLRSDGMGYRAMANEIRFEIARQLLEDTDVPLSQIAASLGYSEASVFTRAFRRWSGSTPTAWRTECRHRYPQKAQTIKTPSSLIKRDAAVAYDNHCATDDCAP